MAALMLLGFAVYMIWDQFHWWSTREDYSFGFLVPLFAGYVIYDRWPLITSHRFRQNGSTKDKSSGSELTVPIPWADWIACMVFFGGIGLFGIGVLLRSVTGPQNPASLAERIGFDLQKPLN